MYNKTIIRFGFLISGIIKVSGKGYKPLPSASVDNPYLGLDYSGVSQKRHPIIAYNK